MYTKRERDTHTHTHTQIATNSNVCIEAIDHSCDGADVFLQESTGLFLLIPCAMREVEAVDNILLDLERSVDQALCVAFLGL